MISVCCIENIREDINLLRKLKILHRKIFTEKFIVPDVPGEHIVYICKINGSIIGMCQILPLSPESYFDKTLEKADPHRQTYLIDFGIIISDRRKGIGTLFLDYIKSDLRNKKYNVIDLHVQTGYKLKKNVIYKKMISGMAPEKVIRFYEKLGFKLSEDEWLHPDQKRKYARLSCQL